MSTPRPLYVRRDLINVAEFQKWAKAQGFDDLADGPHVTVIYSRAAVDWMKMGEDWGGQEITINPGGPRMVERLGPEGVPALLFSSSQLAWRHEDMKREGASFEYAEYQPHITISYEPQREIDVAEIEAYQGKLIFGPEIFEALDDEAADSICDEFSPARRFADMAAGQPRDRIGRWAGKGAMGGGMGSEMSPATEFATVAEGKEVVAQLNAELKAAKAKLAELRAGEKAAKAQANAGKLAAESQAVAGHVQNLKAGLGNENFASALAAVRAAPAKTAIAASRQLTGLTSRTKTEAVQRILRHNENMLSNRMRAATAGRATAG